MSITDVIKELDKYDTSELKELLQAIEDLLRTRTSGKKARIEIEQHQYKGTGKAWVARADRNWKIIDFVEPVSVIPRGYEKKKIYELPPGRYIVNQSGTKSHDSRSYIEVDELGEIKEVNP